MNLRNKKKQIQLWLCSILLAYQKPSLSALLASFLLQTCEHSKENIFLDIDFQHYSTKSYNECGGGKLPFYPLVRNLKPFS